MFSRSLALQVAAAAALALASFDGARAFNVDVINRCEKPIVLAKVTIGSVATESLAPGGTTTHVVPVGAASHVLKSGIGAQATLAEFSAQGGKAWFDISIIPTGPKSGPEYCPNLEACKALTGGVGFNEAMQIAPKTQDGGRCVTLTCMNDGCADGYQFPKDDTKTHVCALNTDFVVTFCPGGKGGQTPPPTPPPTPAPTPSPTPAPTEAPTPTPTPSPVVDDHSAAGSSNSSSHSGETGFSKTSSLLDTSDEVAGDADTAAVSSSTTKTTTTTTTTDVVNTGVSTDAPTNEINVQSNSGGSGGGAGLIVVGILGAVAMVAATAIFAVRRKKMQLDEMESKTPRPTTATAGGGACIMITPNNANVSVL